MATQSGPTALELFNRFQPRFKAVDLIPDGIHFPGSASPFGWEKRGMELNFFHFKVGRYGKPFFANIAPKLDMAQACITFDFSFKGEKSPQGLWADLNEAALAAVKERILANRTFTMYPINPADVVSIRKDAVNLPANAPFVFHDAPFIRLELQYDGDPIPGLECYFRRRRDLAGVDLFIPKDTPEYRAVDALCSLERNQYLQEQGHRPFSELEVARIKREYENSFALANA